jgi:hypothetical protein
MAQNCADAARDRLAERFGESANHPIWGRDNYKVFKDTVDKMWDTVQYIEDNPVKEGLPAQKWDFVTPYDGWPFRRASPPIK